MSHLKTAYKTFEKTLLTAYYTTPSTSDPALAKCKVVLAVATTALSNDDPAKCEAMDWLSYMHKVYSYACTNDDNWSEKRKRALVLKPDHIPERFRKHYVNLLTWWPYMPMISMIFRAIRGGVMAHEVLLSRTVEYTLVAMCTLPTSLSPHINVLARAILRSKSVQIRELEDAQIAATIADLITDSFDKRTRPVARFIAGATTVEEAAKNVRIYISGAIKKRATEYIRSELHLRSEPHVRSELSASSSVPASTMRRWKRNNLDTSDVNVIRNEMMRRKTGVQEGRFSVKTLAKVLNVSPKLVTRALRKAQYKYGFTVEKGRQGIAQITRQQAKWIEDCLPHPEGLEDEEET